MQSIPSLPSLPGTLWPGVVATDRALSMGQIELNWIVKKNSFLNIETVCKQQQQQQNYACRKLNCLKYNLYV